MIAFPPMAFLCESKDGRLVCPLGLPGTRLAASLNSPDNIRFLPQCFGSEDPIHACRRAYSFLAANIGSAKYQACGTVFFGLKSADKSK